MASTRVPAVRAGDVGATTVLRQVPWPGGDLVLDALVVAPSGVWLVVERPWVQVDVDDGAVADGADVTQELTVLARHGAQLAGDLVRLGLAPTEVHPVVRVPGSMDRAWFAGVTVVGTGRLADAIVAPGLRLTADHVDLVRDRCEQIFAHPLPASEIETPVRGIGVVRQRPAHEAGAHAAAAQDSDPYDLDFSSAPPVPTWLSCLTPSQAMAVWKRYPGPLRVRGAFGTGRSVVAVHRAVHLARTRPGRIAVLAPQEPQVEDLRRRVAQLAEPELVGRIVVERPGRLARNVLAELGTQVGDEPATVETIWSAAELTVGLLSTEPGLSDAAFRDEVGAVIKGRGLTSQAQYDQLRAEMPSALRHQVWALYEAYSKEMMRRNLPDDLDVVRMARAALRSGAPTGFDAVVVDDANDLTTTELAFARELVAEAPNAVTLLDDGLPGLHGVVPTAADAGIVEETMVDLDHTFRLNGQVWSAVVELLQHDRAVDLGGAAARPALSGPLDDGEPVHYERSALPALRREKLLARLTSLVEGGSAPGAIAVLVLEDQPDPALTADLTRLGVTTRGLADLDSDAVAVGSARDARGLEVDHVLVADVRHRDMVVGANLDWDQRLRRRLLAMAMARARLSVWIGGA